MSATLDRPRQVGIFGGTFDPIHTGHLILAEQARDEFGLDEILWMPAAVPPHKVNQDITSAHHRWAMVRRAIADNSRFVASRLEIDREGVSYTADTLRILNEQRPSTEFSLLIGTDNLPDLPNWREPIELARRARFLVAHRPDQAEPDFTNLEPILQQAQVPDDRRPGVLHMPLLDISSTNIRARIEAGRSIRYLVPVAVASYIDEYQLYRE